jgi:hypothetical protein
MVSLCSGLAEVVRSRSGDSPAQEGVANRPTHQRDLVPGVDEEGAQLGQQRQNRSKPTHGLTQEGTGRI